jgi:hypothetical protein
MDLQPPVDASSPFFASDALAGKRCIARAEVQTNWLLSATV